MQKRAARACRIPGLLCAVGAGLAAGCLGPEVVVTAGVAAAEVGGSAFVRGQLVQAYRVPIAEATEATRRAIEDLRFTAGTERPGQRSMVFIARQSDGTEVVLRLEEVTPVVIMIKIRVGILGEQSLSRLIMSEIERHLGVGAPTALPPSS